MKHFRHDIVYQSSASLVHSYVRCCYTLQLTSSVLAVGLRSALLRVIAATIVRRFEPHLSPVQRTIRSPVAGGGAVSNTAAGCCCSAGTAS